MMSPDCDETEMLLSEDALDGAALSQTDMARVAEHLRRYSSCRQTAREFVATAAVLPLAPEPVTPSPALRERLMAKVYAEVATDAPNAPRTFWSARVWQRLPRGAAFALAGAAAAVLILAPALASRQATSAGMPPTAVVHLRGTSSDPAAAGRLVYDATDHVAIITVTDVAELPAAGPAARTYEVWLQRRGGATFTPAGFLGHIPNTDTSAAIPVSDIHAMRSSPPASRHRAAVPLPVGRRS